MVAYSFAKQFAEKVESGEKLQTIRAKGKRRPARPGEALQLYTGMRTKSCRKLRDAVCHRVLDIEIRRIPESVILTLETGERRRLTPHEEGDLAQGDGFPTRGHFFHYFCPDATVFVGHLIRWGDE